MLINLDKRYIRYNQTIFS